MMTYQGNIHSRKFVLGVHVARYESGDIIRGEITRFYSILKMAKDCKHHKCIEIYKPRVGA